MLILASTITFLGFALHYLSLELNLGYDLNLGIIALGLVLMAISNALGLSALVTYIADSVPAYKLRRAYGIVYSSLGLCQACGLVVAGYTISLWGYRTIFLIGAFFALGGVLLRLLISETKREIKFERLQDAYVKTGLPFSTLRTRLLTFILVLYLLGGGIALGYYSLVLMWRIGYSLLAVGLLLSAPAGLVVVVLGVLAAWNIRLVCPHCGHTNAADSKYCEKCGGSLREEGTRF